MVGDAKRREDLGQLDAVCQTKGPATSAQSFVAKQYNEPRRGAEIR
ncbi:MAG: hypothetical protein KatS3mg111_1217 [Pirellulaceae bacterium]|nr:MAG: hypothetical protein KatS3mg111_1217 [Pirellulaceae bacterium]